MSDPAQKKDEKMNHLNLEFQIVIEELKEDPSLDKFRKEYEHLFLALKTSNERVRKYMFQFQNLKQGLQMDSYEVEMALKQTEKDENLKKKLIGQIEEVKTLVKTLKERDSKNQDRIKKLKTNIDKISKTIKNWKNLNNGSDEFNERQTEIESLKLDKDLMEQRKMVLLKQIEDTKNKIKERVEKIDEFKFQSVDKNKKILDFKEKLLKQDKRRNREILTIETLKKEKNDYLNKKESITEKKKELKQKMNKKNVDKVDTIKFIKKLDKDLAFRTKHQNEFKKRIIENRKVNKILKKQVQEKNSELQNFKTNCEKLETELEISDQEIKKIKRKLKLKKTNLSQKKDKQKSLKTNVHKLEDNYLKLTASRLDEIKKINDLTRSCNLLRDLLNKIQNNKKEQIEELYKREKEQEVNENNLEIFNKKIKDLKNSEKNLKKKQDKLKEEIELLKDKENFYKDDTKLKNNIISDFKEKNEELKIRIKEQKCLFESVQRDRMVYSKKLRDTQQKSEELKEKCKTFQQQISHLKEEIDEKELLLSKEYNRNMELDRNFEIQKKMKENLTNEEINQGNCLLKINEKTRNLKKEIKILDEEKKNVNKKLETVIEERDKLSIQILKRREEVKILIEKIKIYNSILRKSEYQYNDKESKIKILKKNSKDLLSEINELKKEIKKIPELFVDLNLIEKEYYNEEIKANVLIEELNCPTNVHKWRKLESTDRKNFEMITKLQTLQKRLLKKNDELEKKKKIIQEKEKEIKKIKEKLKRQPSLVEVELSEKLVLSINEKKIQLYNLEDDLNSTKNNFFEVELEMKKLDKELRDVKMKYMKFMKKNFKNKHFSKENFVNNVPDEVFKGGGFCFKKKKKGNKKNGFEDLIVVNNNY